MRKQTHCSRSIKTNVILTQHTCGQYSSMAAGSTRRALVFDFPLQICYMSIMLKCRGESDSGLCMTLRLAKRMPLHSGNFRFKNVFGRKIWQKQTQPCPKLWPLTITTQRTPSLRKLRLTGQKIMVSFLLSFLRGCWKFNQSLRTLVPSLFRELVEILFFYERHRVLGALSKSLVSTLQTTSWIRCCIWGNLMEIFE